MAPVYCPRTHSVVQTTVLYFKMLPKTHFARNKFAYFHWLSLKCVFFSQPARCTFRSMAVTRDGEKPLQLFLKVALARLIINPLWSSLCRKFSLWKPLTVILHSLPLCKRTRRKMTQIECYTTQFQGYSHLLPRTTFQIIYLLSVSSWMTPMPWTPSTTMWESSTTSSYCGLKSFRDQWTLPTQRDVGTGGAILTRV